MPLKLHPIDVAGVMLNGKAKSTVDYVTLDKLTKPARVLGPGTASGLKLLLDGKTVLDNVAPATTMFQTNVYRYRDIK